MPRRCWRKSTQMDGIIFIGTINLVGIFCMLSDYSVQIRNILLWRNNRELWWNNILSEYSTILFRHIFCLEQCSVQHYLSNDGPASHFFFVQRLRWEESASVELYCSDDCDLSLSHRSCRWIVTRGQWLNRPSVTKTTKTLFLLNLALN